MSDPIIESRKRMQADRELEQVSLKLQSIARMIDRELSKLKISTDTGRPLFSLFVYAGGQAQYVANAQREDVKTVVATVLARWDADEAHKPFHEQETTIRRSGIQ